MDTAPPDGVNDDMECCRSEKDLDLDFHFDTALSKVKSPPADMVLTADAMSSSVTSSLTRPLTFSCFDISGDLPSSVTHGCICATSSLTEIRYDTTKICDDDVLVFHPLLFVVPGILPF